MVVINQSERYAQSGYFFRRNLPLPSIYLKINGEVFYQIKIQKEIEFTTDKDIRLFFAA